MTRTCTNHPDRPAVWRYSYDGDSYYWCEQCGRSYLDGRSSSPQLTAINDKQPETVPLTPRLARRWAQRAVAAMRPSATNELTGYAEELANTCDDMLQRAQLVHRLGRAIQAYQRRGHSAALRDRIQQLRDQALVGDSVPLSVAYQAVYYGRSMLRNSGDRRKLAFTVQELAQEAIFLAGERPVSLVVGSGALRVTTGPHTVQWRDITYEMGTVEVDLGCDGEELCITQAKPTTKPKQARDSRYWHPNVGPSGGLCLGDVSVHVHNLFRVGHLRAAFDDASSILGNYGSASPYHSLTYCLGLTDNPDKDFELRHYQEGVGYEQPRPAPAQQPAGLPGRGELLGVGEHVYSGERGCFGCGQPATHVGGLDPRYVYCEGCSRGFVIEPLPRRTPVGAFDALLNDDSSELLRGEVYWNGRYWEWDLMEDGILPEEYCGEDTDWNGELEDTGAIFRPRDVSEQDLRSVCDALFDDIPYVIREFHPSSQPQIEVPF